MTCNNHQNALVQKFPKIEQLPRIPLGKFPTPVQKLINCSENLHSDIWIKRDDLCNEKYGGNKPRKYEYVLAKAQSKKKSNIVTVGGTGSNHVLANTIYAKELGMDSDIYLFDQPLSQHVRLNLLCDNFYQAKIHYTKGYLRTILAILWKLITNWKSFLVMPGASVPIGTVGFVNAGLELAEQVNNNEMPEPDHLFVAVGSTGTCAGLLLGLELAGLKTKLHGISVSLKVVTEKKKVIQLAKKTLKLLRKIDPTLPDVSDKLDARLEVDHSYYGGEYGRATFEGLDAIKMVDNDNIHLDITYTGKAFSGLIGYCQEHPECQKETILFWNTLNSVDLTPLANQVDYHDLPEPLHQFFDGTIPIDETPVKAKTIK